MSKRTLTKLFLFFTLLMFVQTAAMAAPRLVINDSIVASASAPVIVGGRLLVPARVVSEQLGAQVKWLKEKNAVQITKDKTVIELVVGAKQAKVSGKTVKIDSPVQIINSRVYVPVRFIGESLGATVSWDKKSETAKINAQAKPAATGTTTGAPIQPTQPVTPVQPTQPTIPVAPTNPATTTDNDQSGTPNEDETTASDTTTSSSVTGSSVVTSQPAITPQLPEGTVMLTTANAEANSAGVNLYVWGDKSFEAKVTEENDNGFTAEISGAYLTQGSKEIKIKKSGVESIVFEQVSTDKPLVRIKAVSNSGKLFYTKKTSDKGDTIAISIPNRLMNLEKTTSAGKEVFAMKTSGPLEVSAYQPSGDKYVVEFPYTVADLKEKSIVPNSSAVQKINVEDVDVSGKATARVTFILNNTRNGRVSVETGSNKIIVAFSPRLEQAEITEGKTSTMLKLTADDAIAGNYRISYIDKGIAIDFPFMSWAGKDKIIKAAGSVQACRVMDNPLISKGFRIELDLPIRAKYNSSVSSDGKTLNFEILKAQAATVPNLSSKKIMIDPGHGGKDSGAIATNGGYEKDYNLAIANFLYQKLNASGAQVMMTRYDDTYLTLQQRTDLANSNGADIFVAIHHNANGDPTKSGTESYYYSNVTNSQKLASLVASKVSAATGLSNRGAKRHMFYVVNHTKMPSALLETCFISTPSENARAKDPSFQETVAQALYEAISAYLLQ